MGKIRKGMVKTCLLAPALATIIMECGISRYTRVLSFLVPRFINSLESETN